MPYKDKEKQAASQKKYYLKNKEKYTNACRKRRKNYQDWILEIKQSLECSECPEKHPAVLDFHHVDEKENSICNMVSSRVPKKIILAEIEKCIVLCANCHRKLHWNEHKS